VLNDSLQEYEDFLELIDKKITYSISMC